ncbi:MAG: hypothetical protein PHW75_02910 [Patescibacteria group bacterium]|nr:hypothetical protein [Patescibacteria group bacterium]
MHELMLESSALSLGFIMDRALLVLEGMSDEDEQSQLDILGQASRNMRLLYLTDASDLIFRHSEILHLVAGGLREAVQARAGKEGRMANQMAERTIATLEQMVLGVSTEPKDIEWTKRLLGFVAEGSLDYVQQLQGPIVR